MDKIQKLFDDAKAKIHEEIKDDNLQNSVDNELEKLKKEVNDQIAPISGWAYNVSEKILPYE